VKTLSILTVGLAVFFTAARPCPAQPAASVSLAYDEHGTAVSGAENTYFVGSLFSGLIERGVPARIGDESDIVGASLGVLYRLARLVLLDANAAFYPMLVQHEVYGHGGRYREFGFRYGHGEFDFLRPIGSNRGSYSQGQPPPGFIESGRADAATSVGGVEATELLGRKVSDGWMLGDAVTPSSALLYFFAANDGLFYALLTRESGNRHGNDMVSSLAAIHRSYGGGPEGEIRLSTLKQQTLVNVANPYTLVALYTVFVRFLALGEPSMVMPTIPLFDWNVMVAPRLVLTPFGTEARLEATAAHDELIGSISIGAGISPQANSTVAAAARLAHVGTGQFNVGASVGIWHQPAFTIDLGKPHDDGGLGAHANVRASILVGGDSVSQVRIWMQVGYKSHGFVPGEPIASGTIVRGGVSARLRAN
jgi:hypothetical protein